MALAPAPLLVYPPASRRLRRTLGRCGPRPSGYAPQNHLGSVTELVDSTGKVRAAYRYAPYGRRSKVSGDLDSDWGFAGLWHHEPSGLDLATYRAYDATRGRWLSRDPLGEAAGLNLLQYCGGDPLNNSDPAGLQETMSRLRPFVKKRTEGGLQ